MTQALNVTKDLILGLKPGYELDALVGNYIANDTPQIVWEYDTKKWPDGEVKMVRREIYRNFSESISDAMDVEKMMGSEDYRSRYIEIITWFFLEAQGVCEVYDLMQASPEMRCKAALLVKFDLF